MSDLETIFVFFPIALSVIGFFLGFYVFCTDEDVTFFQGLSKSRQVEKDSFNPIETVGAGGYQCEACKRPFQPVVLTAEGGYECDCGCEDKS